LDNGQFTTSKVALFNASFTDGRNVCFVCPHCKKILAVVPSPELVVLVDFKAIYPGVPPGIFASFPGVAHFLSFEQICQYPMQGKS
jgi:hypothetical protein